MKKACLLLSLVFLLTACPIDREYSLTVKNTSNQTICVCAWYIFPDTLLPVNKPFCLEVKPNKIGSIHGHYVNDNTFKRLEKGEKLTLFVLSKDSVDVHSWEYLREHNVILKRYEFDKTEKLPIIYP